MQIGNQLVEIGQDEHEGSGLALPVGNLAAVFIEQEAEIGSHLGDFSLRQGHVAPIVRPSVVENVPDDPEIVAHSAPAEIPHLKALVGLRLAHDAQDILGKLSNGIQIVRPQILGFAIAEPFDPRRVVWPGVTHHDSRAVFEAVDQQSAFLVDREVEGTKDAHHATVLKPAFGRLEQRPEYRRVIGRLHETEMTGPLPMTVLGQLVDLGADPTNRLAIAIGDPVVSRGVLKIGVLVLRQQIEPLEHQRSHPRGIVAVQGRGEPDEGLEGLPVRDPLYADGRGFRDTHPSCWKTRIRIRRAARAGLVRCPTPRSAPAGATLPRPPLCSDESAPGCGCSR